MSFLDLEWWEYCIIIVLFFMAFLFINYVVKKFNEARIEDRLSRLLQKASNNQGTQIQELSLEIETNKLNTAPSNHNLDKCKPQLAGISLVFNREDNINRGIKRNNDTIDTNPGANFLDMEKIKKISLTHKERLLPNKLNQNAENTKTIFPKSIVIKDSKDTCTKSVVLPTERSTQKPEETMYMKIRKTFFKPNKLQPKAVPKVTNIGSIFVKDSKIDNHSNKDNVQISQTIKESQHHGKSDSLLKFNKSKSITPKENNSITACQNSTEPALQISEISQKVENTPFQATTDSVLKTDILKPIAPAMKETNIISILLKEPKADYNMLKKSDLQILNISQNTKETISLRKSDSIVVTDKLHPQTPTTQERNSDSIIDRDSKIANNNSSEALLQIPKTIQKSVDSYLVQNSKQKFNNSIESELAKSETVQKSNDRLPQEINDVFMKTDEVKASTAKETSIGSNLDKGSKIVLNNGTETELLTPDTLQKSKDNLSQERSSGFLKTNNIEPKSSPAKKTDIGNNLAKDVNIFNTSTESAFVTSETSQSTEQLSLELYSDITLYTTDSEQNDTQGNLASSINKHNDSKGSSSSSITIGLLMTEISLKTNKMYAGTDPLETNDFEDHKTYLVNIPVIDTKVGNDTSTYKLSEMSTIADEISLQKESDILSQDDKLGVKKSMKIKADEIIKQPMITFSTPTMPKAILPETDKTLSHNLSDTSRNQYNQRVKKFWALFTTKYRS